MAAPTFISAPSPIRTARLVWTLPAPPGAAPGSIASFAPAQTTAAFATSKRYASSSPSTWRAKTSCAPSTPSPSSASPASGCTTKCPRHLPTPATPSKPPPRRPWARLFELSLNGLLNEDALVAQFCLHPGFPSGHPRTAEREEGVRDQRIADAHMGSNGAAEITGQKYGP